jgi:hypothetical protein
MVRAMVSSSPNGEKDEILPFIDGYRRWGGKL